MTIAPLGEYTSIAWINSSKTCQYSLMLDKGRLSSQTGWLMSRPFRHALVSLWIYIYGDVPFPPTFGLLRLGKSEVGR
jgi:hypothetical protein